MDLHSFLQNDQKSATMSLIYDNMPKYLSSKHRVHRLFFKKCDDQIGTYQNCIGDSSWKANIDKYINHSLRRKCYNEWVQVRRCAVRHLGDSFAMKINMTRQIENDLQDEETLIENYKQYYENKKFIHKFEKVQGPPAEEEAAEGEGEEEAAEEEAAEEGSSEEGSEEKTEEPAGGEENSDGSAADDSRKIVEEESGNVVAEHPEITASEDSSDE